MCACEYMDCVCVLIYDHVLHIQPLHHFTCMCLLFNDVMQLWVRNNSSQRSKSIAQKSGIQPVLPKPQVRTGSSLEGGIEGGGKGVSTREIDIE